MIKLPDSLPKPAIYALAIVVAALFLLLLILGGKRETRLSGSRPPRPGEDIPLPAREFRAAWVATVANIDWPSAPDLSTARQRKEAIAILDRLVDLKMNAVIFQVRPQADALYRSKLEPWSYFLTGEQGKAPDRKFDPLEFWVEQAHRRGLQIHAWFNPYRANHKANEGPISEQSVIKTHPELVVKLGDEGYWWLDPSQEAARAHTIKVVMDVVNRYDIDGVHFDDYFYPYPSYNNNEDFPDEASYRKYLNQGGSLARGDWRRESVNQLIRELNPRIKQAKRHVEFGISPFGIWRPGHPGGIKGLDQYDVLYADARLWLNEGWVDYFAPQLYWPIDSEHQSFGRLLAWWKEQNPKGRHLWPGLTISGAKDDAGATETVHQIMMVRKKAPRGSGVCLFSMKDLMKRNYEIGNALKVGPWSGQALIPTTPWIKSHPPAPPIAELWKARKRKLFVRFGPREKESAFQFVLSERRGTKWLPPKIIPGIYRSYELSKGVDAVAVRSVDRFRNLSVPVIVELEK